MKPAPLRTILTQDGRVARAWLADAAKEPWLLLGLPLVTVAGGVLLFLGARRLADQSLTQAGALGMAVGLALGFGIVRASRRQASAEVLGGAFGALMADGRERAGIVLGRAALAGLGLVAGPAALVAAAWPPAPAGVFLSGLAIAALVGATAAMTLPERGADTSSRGRRARAVFGWPALAWRLSSGARGLVPAALCAALATAVALSGLHQDSTALARTAVFFGALAAGLCLLPLDGALARLLAAGRAPMWRLTVGALAVPTLVALIAGAAVALTGPSPDRIIAALVAGACIAALATLRLFIDVTGDARSSPLRFGVELALIVMAAAVLAPLAAVWTGLRLVLLGRRASRRRWSLT